MPDGSLYVAVGASRSGKTAWVRQQIEGEARIMAWDPECQYGDLPGAQIVRTHTALAAAAKNPGPGVYVFQAPRMADFGFWAECCFLFARVGDYAGVKTVIVAEELADVTNPSKAPDGWGMLVRRGLKRNCDIYAITQRPAESDKTIMGNASVIHCCGLQRAGDRDYMAKEMDVPATAISSLDRSKLEYLHKDMRTGEGHRGALSFTRKPARLARE